MKIFVTLLSVMFLVSCAAAVSPSYDMTVSYQEDAPDEWKLGWQHGCESGLSVYGNNYYKTLYKFKQDVSMLKNEYYFKSWNDSFNYCRSAINRRLSGDTLSNEEVPSLFSTKDLNITQGMKRDNAPITKQGFMFGGAERGLFSDMFDVKLMGQGSTAWGASVDKCDWLNRCGKDKPKDPMEAMMGW